MIVLEKIEPNAMTTCLKALSNVNNHKHTHTLACMQRIPCDDGGRQS